MAVGELHPQRAMQSRAYGMPRKLDAKEIDRRRKIAKRCGGGTRSLRHLRTRLNADSPVKVKGTDDPKQSADGSGTICGRRMPFTDVDDNAGSSATSAKASCGYISKGTFTSWL